MPRLNKKRKAVIADQAGPSEPERTEETGPQRVIVRKVSAAATTMLEETHPWLKWPGCNAARKIELNNKLAEMQNRALCAPRFIEEAVVTSLGIKTRLLNMFTTQITDEGSLMEIPIWSRALNIKEKVHREWCLEFYASLRIDKKFQPHEFYSKKLIHFRLGGAERSVSVTEFGVLTGLFTEGESRSIHISPYLLKGALNSKEFSAEKDRAWLELTKSPQHSSLSKVSAIRSPLLRLVHKLLVYSFIHRSTQHDKCYQEDLWLLHTLNKGDSEIFICVPWVLVCFMETKGAGKTKDSQICCGHFITRMIKNLGLFTPANVRACSAPVNYKKVTLHDLEASKLLNEAGTALKEIESDSEAETGEPAAPGRRSKGRESILGALQELNKGNRELKRICAATQRMVNCLSERLEYHIHRYRPVLEKLAAADAATASTSLAPYAPPPPFAPISADEETEPEESGDEETEAEEEEEE